MTDPEIIPLPDGQHELAFMHSETHVYWTIFHKRKGSVLSGNIPVKTGWEGLKDLTIKLAEKKYPAKKDQQLRDYQHSYRR